MANYYVNTSSTGTGNGTTTATTGANAAFKTIAEVNAATFAAGDSVLFNRGQTWREQLIPDSGSAGGVVTYGAYGTGNKPKLLGSVTKNSTGDWTDETGNIWRTATSSFTDDVGNLIFNNEASCGIKQMSATPTIDTQGDFWYDFTNDRIRLYSVGNPATFYTNIECALTKSLILATNKSYITFDNLDLRYSSRHGFSCTGDDHITIRNCDLSYIGGGDLLEDYTVRFGNGIQFYTSGNNLLVEKCRIDNVYDAGTTVQGEGAGTFQYVYFRNNIITNCEYSYEFFDYVPAVVDSVYFENNTCVNAGSGWGHNQRPDGVNARHFIFTDDGTIPTNFYIRNNIFSGATESLIKIVDISQASGMTIDYNDLYQASGHIGRIGSTNYDTLATWRTASGQDAHSISGNPLLVSASDFHLQAGSPAIDKGATLAEVTDDYDGVVRPQGSVYDIGAYESLTGGTLLDASIRRRERS